MAEPTYAFISAQSATSVTIDKTALQAALTAAGITYTPASNEPHESLIWAVLKAVQQTATQDAWNNNADASLFIAPGFGTTVATKSGVTNSLSYLQPTLTVTASKVVDTNISPNDL